MLSKLLLCGGMFLSASLVFGEFVIRPDANTLWREDGKNISTEFDGKVITGWDARQLEVKGGDDGFTIGNVTPEKVTTLHYLPTDPAYPYLVYEISEVEQQKGYKGFFMYTIGIPCNRVEQIANVPAGEFVFNCYENQPSFAAARQCLRMDLYGMKIKFKSLKMVKEPDNFIKVESADLIAKKSIGVGDVLKFTVKLADDAEDVNIKLHNPYTMVPVTLNRLVQLQLKPVDGNLKLWQGEIKIDSIEGRFLEKAKYLMTEAVILGSESGKPLFGAINYPVRNETK